MPADEDPRSRVMAWMRAPDNPYFARVIVNRIWAHYFGRGIVDPPDHLSPLNPASHPELLAELADGFVKHGYDLRWVHRTILQSRTYQQSMKSNATNRADTRNYARFYPRRLAAELLIDAINQATGSSENWPPDLRMAPGARAIEFAGEIDFEHKNSPWAYALHIFGRPRRELDVQCDCNRQASATIVQTLYLANHPSVREKIGSTERAGGAGRPAIRRSRPAGGGGLPLDRQPAADAAGTQCVHGVPEGRCHSAERRRRVAAHPVANARIHPESLMFLASGGRKPLFEQ